MSFFASLERLTFYTVSVSLVKKQVTKTKQLCDNLNHLREKASNVDCAPLTGGKK